VYRREPGRPRIPKAVEERPVTLLGHGLGELEVGAGAGQPGLGQEEGIPGATESAEPSPVGRDAGGGGLHERYGES
jgi:hypothetical protein